MKNNYNNRLVKAIAVGFGLALSNMAFSQQTFTFTNAGAAGRFGPTQTQVNTAYASTNLNGSVTVNGGVQQFVVGPGVYRIAAYGAQGGTCNTTYPGGLGARIEGDFTLTAGSTTLNILVGQEGEYYLYNTGGGGGSFVWITGQAQPLIVAGGGGGAGYSANGVNASTTTAGTAGTGATGLPGTGGNGANPGGGGWLNDGQNFTGGVTTCGQKCSGANAGVTYGGASPTTTILYHGCAGTYSTGDGGFGGASGGNGYCTSSYGGGGGGGYSGGAGQTGASAGGGGGGSYNGGTNQVNQAGANQGNGRVIITELCNVSILSTTTGSTIPAVVCAGNSLTLTTNAISNYSWSNGATTSSIVVAPTTNTVYTIVGTSSMNCTAMGSMSVVVSAAAPVLTVTTGQNPICAGASTSLQATGAVTYTWSGGLINGQNVTPLTTTAYTVQGQNGCGITTMVRTVTVTPLVVTALASPTLVCEGYTAALTAASSVSGYTWSTPAGTVTGASILVSPMAPTIYTVAASDGTCAGTQTVEVQTKTTPVIVPSTTFVTICAGESIQLSASGAGNGGSYLWTPGNLNTQNVTVSPATSTLYTIVGTNSLNCSATANIPIQVVSGPAINVSTNKAIICSGNSTSLIATGAPNYTWTNGPINTLFYVTPAATTVYTVIGTNNTSTCQTTATIQISVIVPNVIVSPSLQICPGKAATLTASGANGYVWSGLGNQSTYTVSPTVNTTYTVVASTGTVPTVCNTTLTTFVKVNDSPTISIAATKTTQICKGVTNTLTANGAQSYTWSTGATTNSITVTPSVTTVYTLTALDNNNCEGSQQIVVLVNKCTGIEETNLESIISIFPNPNAGVFSIHATRDLELRLFNTLGQLVKTISIEAASANSINVSELSNGVYLLKNANAGSSDGIRIMINK